MYTNGQKLAKRISRKIAEEAFDTEVLRAFLFDMDFNNEEQWAEVVGNLDDIVEAFTMARDVAKAALAEIQPDPPPTPTDEQKHPAETSSGSPVNPFVAKKPADPKAKGG